MNLVTDSNTLYLHGFDSWKEGTCFLNQAQKSHERT